VLVRAPTDPAQGGASHSTVPSGKTVRPNEDWGAHVPSHSADPLGAGRGVEANHARDYTAHPLNGRWDRSAAIQKPSSPEPDGLSQAAVRQDRYTTTHRDRLKTTGWIQGCFKRPHLRAQELSQTNRMRFSAGSESLRNDALGVCPPSSHLHSTVLPFEILP
jgi:hypothetical protein